MSCGLAVSKSSRRFWAAAWRGAKQVLVFGPVGEAAREVIFLEGLGIADATVEEVVGVRKADYHRTHQDELADQRGILQSEIDG